MSIHEIVAEMESLTVEEQRHLLEVLLRLLADAPEGALEDNKSAPGVFFRTALSMNYEGPADLSENHNAYLYGGAPHDG